ncbi:MAG: hypothetical protein Q8L48_36625 [Archangium sp.]|nr:hypothetical protein [Archangium sp.]
MTKIQRVTKPQVKSTSTKAAAKALPKEVQQLAKSKRAEVTKNADGSVTRRRTTAQTSKELNTSTGKLLETTLEYRKSATTRRGTQSDSTFVSKTDMLGRKSIEARRETTNAQGDTSIYGRTADVFGVEKQTTEKNTTRERGDTLETATRTTSKDSRGNKARSSDVTRVTEQGKSVVTTNEKRASGSDLTTRSSTTYEDGKFTLSDGADWLKNTSVDKSYLKETEVDSTKFLEKSDKVTGFIGKIFKALGLEGEWQKTLSEDLMKSTTLFEGDHGSVTTQVGVTGSQRFAIDGDGIEASFDREARAGVYAHAHDEVTGRFGEASYDANAKAEAYARIDGQARIDANGLDAQINAKVGVAIEADITARAQSKSVTFAGTELYAAVDGRARVAAEASAEATGTVKITRNPPTAIARGTAGASAVVKAEGELKLSAGPFSVVGSAYASAGAEARATGVIGYEDGKFKIGGSAGAALGLGAGAGVTVEIDVRQIGEMAKNAADVNGDGKLGFDDATAAVGKSARKVAGWFGFGN